MELPFFSIKMMSTYIFAALLVSCISNTEIVGSILLPKESTDEGVLSGLGQSSSRESIFSRMSFFSDYEERLKSFFGFLLQDSPSDHLYVIYDEKNNEDLSPFLPSLWSGFSSDVTLLPYEQSLDIAEPLLRSFNHAGKIKNVLVLCEENSTFSILKEVQTLSLESPTLRWLVVVEDHSLLDGVLSLIREGTQITVSVGHITEKIEFFTSFIDTDNRARFRKLKTWWVNDEGKTNTKRDGPPRKDPAQEYEDFQGRWLLIATLRNIPFLDLIPSGEFVTPIGGIEFHLLNIMKKTYNFSFRMKLPFDGQWGEVFPNGSATGIVGMVARRETDFCMGELTIMGAREAVVDFSQPYFTESTTLVTRAPKKKSQALALLTPFTPEAWLAIVIGTIVMGPLLTLLSIFSAEYQSLSLVERLTEFQFGVFRTMTYQDSNLKLQPGPVRAVVVSWYIFAYFVFILYSNMLIASLIVPKFEEPIDSLEDLLKATKDGAVMLVNPGSSFEFIFKKAEHGIYANIWDNFDPSVGYVPDSHSGVAAVLKARKVFVTAEMKSKVLSTMMGKKKFNIARNTFYPQSYGIAFRSGTPYQSHFNKILLRLSETGLISKWTNDELNALERKSAFGGGKQIEDKETEDEDKLEPFSLSHLQAAFYLLAIGYSLASIVLIVERSCCKG